MCKNKFVLEPLRCAENIVRSLFCFCEEQPHVLRRWGSATDEKTSNVTSTGDGQRDCRKENAHLQSISQSKAVNSVTSVYIISILCSLNAEIW